LILHAVTTTRLSSGPERYDDVDLGGPNSIPPGAVLEFGRFDHSASQNIDAVDGGQRVLLQLGERMPENRTVPSRRIDRITRRAASGSSGSSNGQIISVVDILSIWHLGAGLIRSE
jgi:hypothetical protein